MVRRWQGLVAERLPLPESRRLVGSMAALKRGKTSTHMHEDARSLAYAVVKHGPWKAHLIPHVQTAKERTSALR